MKLRGPLFKLLLFTAVSGVLTTLVVTTVINPTSKAQVSFRALFTDISGMRVGDVVRVAGVGVGNITDERLVDGKAEVTFAVDRDQAVTTSTGAQIRYQNLLGQRFLALVPGADGGQPLAPGALIPLSRTAGALDLTTLFNGFQPLFAALTPDQINKLTTLIVQALQGESGAVDNLLQQTAALTNNLADRDAVIGQVIDHLAGFLKTVASHDQQLGQIIDQLQILASGLAGDRAAIGDSLSQIDVMTASLNGLVSSSRPALDRDIAGLRALTDTLAANQDKLGVAVNGLPALMTAFVRVLDYGSWINLYVCDLVLLAQNPPIPVPTGPVADLSHHSSGCR
jgi:phospholipid/cholesterol/gamma-HCH transport system substrate-binding protein